jgi:hypothetical protein
MFEKGKWYKGVDNSYRKCSETRPDHCRYSEIIISKSWRKDTGNAYWDVREATLEEIQEYLPEGHPDKITQDEYKVGDWVIVSLGSVEYVAKLTRISPPKGRFKVLNTSDSLQKGEGSFDKIVRKAKLEEIPLTDLSNDEILEIAKQYYPVGTTYWNLDMVGNRSNKDIDAKPHTLLKDCKPFIEMYNYKGFPIICRGNGNGYVYSGGKWAEIISTSQEVKDDFVLPEKWCIEITNENRNLLQTFYEQNIGKYKGCSKDWMIGKNGGFFVYPGDRHFHTCTESSAQQRWKNKITTEQFKKYVLGEKVETNYIFPTELLEKRLEQLETSNEIYIPTITKEKKKIDYTINSVFADIKVNLPEKPKKIVKSIVLEKFNLII